MASRSLSFLHHPNLALLILRLAIGVVGFYHGSQKLFGLFEGAGIRGFAGYLEQLSVPLPYAVAILVGIAEFFGGLLMAVGLFTRLAAIPFFCIMLVAIIKVHNAHFEVVKGGMEYAMTMAAIALALVLAGPGRLSLDHVWRLDAAGKA